MGSIRLKGTKLSLKIDEVEYKGDLISYKITNEEKDADVTTFEDMESGNTAQFILTIGMIQSTAQNSLFAKFWENTGKECEFILAPHGNAQASADEPHYKGLLTIPNPPEFGGEASNSAYTSEVSCKLSAKPEKVTNSEM
ncbi:hypothetical protein RQN30_10710 [Arcanobacterium hippocoleae]